MSVTQAAVADVLSILTRSCTGLANADAEAWATVLNAAPLTIPDGRGNRVPMRNSQGLPVQLAPRDEELMPAALQLAGTGARFIQAGSLALAIQELREGDEAARKARIQADIAKHGLLLPAGLGADVEAELAWRRAATAAIAAGASRAQATAHAWRAIGRTLPQIEAAPSVPGVPGYVRARQLAAQLADRARA